MFFWIFRNFQTSLFGRNRALPTSDSESSRNSITMDVKIIQIHRMGACFRPMTIFWDPDPLYPWAPPRAPGPRGPGAPAPRRPRAPGPVRPRLISALVVGAQHIIRRGHSQALSTHVCPPTGFRIGWGVGGTEMGWLRRRQVMG